MRLIYLIKWSFLRDLSTALLSRSLFIISMAPFILRLISLLNFVKINPILLEVAFAGAILFALTSFAIKLFAPPPILNQPNSQAYQSYITSNADAVDFAMFFRELPDLLVNISEFCSHVDRSRLEGLMPPETAPRKIGTSKAAFSLSYSHYELLDISRPYLRNTIAVFTVTSVLLMLCSVIKSSATIMGDLIQCQ